MKKGTDAQFCYSELYNYREKCIESKTHINYNLPFMGSMYFFKLIATWIANVSLRLKKVLLTVASGKTGAFLLGQSGTVFVFRGKTVNLLPSL